MTTTRFDDSNFSRASFKNARITNAFFINTDLSLSSLLNAVITGVGTTFENANLRGATYFGGETCDTTSIGTCNPI